MLDDFRKLIWFKIAQLNEVGKCKKLQPFYRQTKHYFKNDDPIPIGRNQVSPKKFIGCWGNAHIVTVKITCFKDLLFWC